MGIHNFQRPGVADDVVRSLGEYPQQCYFCHEPIEPGWAVYWASEPPIFLHPNCARDLACNLIADAQTARHEERKEERVRIVKMESA